MYCFSCFPIAFCLLIYSTAGQDFEITCPSNGFTVGVKDSVTCKVEKTAFASACIRTPTLIKFHFTPLNGVQNEWCTSSYSTCPNTGTPDALCGTCTCGCEKDDGTFITHRLEFIPTSAHRNGSFTCEVVCLNSGNLPTLTSQNCSGLLVAAPTTTTPDTTSVAPTTAPPNTTSAPPGTSAPGTNLLYLLLLLLLIPIVVVIIIVWYCFCHNGGINGTKKAEEGELKSSPQNQQTTNGNRTVDGKGSTQNQETTNGNKTADGKRSGQRDNKVGTGHVATNGAHNGEKVSKPVQETELTKVKETSSAPSGVEETSLNGTS